MSKFKSELNKIDDVYQIKIDVPFQVKFVCCYILKIKGKNVLIDAGFNSPAWKKIFLQEIKAHRCSLVVSTGNGINFCAVAGG